MLAELSVRLEVPIESAKIQQSILDAMADVNSEIGDALTIGIMRAAQSRRVPIRWLDELSR